MSLVVGVSKTKARQSMGLWERDSLEDEFLWCVGLVLGAPSETPGRGHASAHLLLLNRIVQSEERGVYAVTITLSPKCEHEHRED